MFTGHVLEPVRAPVARLVPRLDTGRRKPVRPFPAELAAETGAGRRKAFVERRRLYRSSRLVLLAWPSHGVMLAGRLGRALDKKLRIAVMSAETPDVHRPQVHRRFATDNPLRQRPPRPTVGRDAVSVETGADKIAGQFRRLAEDETAVRRERLRAVDELPDSGVFQRRHPARRLQKQALELIPVAVEQLKMKVARDAVLRRPRHRLQLVATHHEAADLLLEIAKSIRVAQRREVGGHPFNRLGDEVLVLHRLHRHGNVGQATAFARPDAATVDRDLTLDVAQVRLHPGHPAVANVEPGHPTALDDFCALHLRALGQGLTQIGRTRLPIGRQERCANHVRDIHQRPKLLGFAGRKQMHLEPETVRGSRLSLDFGQALVVAGQAQPAVGFPAGGLPRLRLELAVKLDAVLEQLRNTGRAAELADQAGGVKRRAAGQRLALEHDDILPAEPREVIRHAAPDDAAADDDHPRACGKHCVGISFRGHSRFRKRVWLRFARRRSPTPCRGIDPG